MIKHELHNIIRSRRSIRRYKATPISLEVIADILEVERELSMSYPTVRNRLDRVIKALGYEIEEDKSLAVDRMSVLEKLETQEIDVDEAISKLKGE
jgi:hypothetical protein